MTISLIRFFKYVFMETLSSLNWSQCHLLLCINEMHMKCHNFENVEHKVSRKFETWNVVALLPSQKLSTAWSDILCQSTVLKIFCRSLNNIRILFSRQWPQLSQRSPLMLNRHYRSDHSPHNSLFTSSECVDFLKGNKLSLYLQIFCFRCSLSIRCTVTFLFT